MASARNLTKASSVPVLCPPATDQDLLDIVEVVAASLGVGYANKPDTMRRWVASAVSVVSAAEAELAGAGIPAARVLRSLVGVLAPQVAQRDLLRMVRRMLRLALAGYWFFPLAPFDVALWGVSVEDCGTAHLPEVAAALRSANTCVSAVLVPLAQALFVGALPVALCTELARACLGGQAGAALARAGLALLAWNRSSLRLCSNITTVMGALVPAGVGPPGPRLCPSIPGMPSEASAGLVLGPVQYTAGEGGAGVRACLDEASAQQVIGHAEFVQTFRFLLHKNAVLSRQGLLPWVAPRVVVGGGSGAGAASRPSPPPSPPDPRLRPHQVAVGLDSYHWVGFDLDHSLAPYNDGLLTQHIFYAALEHLRSKFPVAGTAAMLEGWTPPSASAAAEGGVEEDGEGGPVQPPPHTPDAALPGRPWAVVAALHSAYYASAAPSDAAGRGTGHRRASFVAKGMGGAAPGALNAGPEPLWLHLAETGLILDRVAGHVLWVDATRRVVMGYHGPTRLSHAELQAAYGGAEGGGGPLPRLPPSALPPPSTFNPANPTGGPRFLVLHTGFDAPMGPLFGLLVATADSVAAKAGWAPPPDYSHLAGAAASAVQFTYTRFASRGMPAVLADPLPFLQLGAPPPAAAATAPSARPKRRSFIPSLRGGGEGGGATGVDPAAYHMVPQAVKSAAGRALLGWLKGLRGTRVVGPDGAATGATLRTFLLTNADHTHAAAVLTALLGPDWRSAFDLVIVSASKKRLFERGMELGGVRAWQAPSAPHQRSFRALDTSAAGGGGGGGGPSGRARTISVATLSRSARDLSAGAGSRAHRVASITRLSRGDSMSSDLDSDEGGGWGGSGGPRRRRTISGERGGGPGVDRSPLLSPALRASPRLGPHPRPSPTLLPMAAGAAAEAVAPPRSDSGRSVGPPPPPILLHPLDLSKQQLFSGGNLPQLQATLAEAAGLPTPSRLRVLYVGDHVATDVQLAGKCGWHTLGVSARLRHWVAAEGQHAAHVASGSAAAAQAAVGFHASLAGGDGGAVDAMASWTERVVPSAAASTPPPAPAASAGLSVGHPLLLSLTSRNVGKAAPSAAHHQAASGRAPPRMTRAKTEVGRREGGSDAAVEGGGGDGATPPSSDAETEGAAEGDTWAVPAACTPWSTLPAYAWDGRRGGFHVTQHGRGGGGRWRGTGGGGHDHFWPLSVHRSCSDARALGPDVPLGPAGAMPTWLEGQAIAAPLCVGLIPSVEWLVRAVPGGEGGSGSPPPPSTPPSKAALRKAGTTAAHFQVEVQGGASGGGCGLLGAPLRKAWGWPKDVAFAHGLGAEPPPSPFWQAFSACYRLPPMALAHSPFAVQVDPPSQGVEGGGADAPHMTLRPLPSTASVLTAATASVPRQLLQGAWGAGSRITLRLRGVHTDTAWRQGLWKWLLAVTAAHAPGTAPEREEGSGGEAAAEGRPSSGTKA